MGTIPSSHTRRCNFNQSLDSTRLDSTRLDSTRLDVLEFSTQIVVVVVVVVVFLLQTGWIGNTTLRKDLLDEPEIVFFLDLGNLFVVLGFLDFVLLVQSFQIGLEFIVGLL